MAIADLVYPSDIARRPNCFAEENGGENMNEQKCECGCKPEQGWMPVPIPPVPVVPCPHPGPWYPPYPVPVPQPVPDPEPPKGSVAQQICKLSRKANIITKMLENLETRKKDVIITIGGVSYNFGNIDLDLGEGWPDGSYAATVKTILEYELSLIKTKIAELATELGEEADNLTGGIEGTVGP